MQTTFLIPHSGSNKPRMRRSRREIRTSCKQRGTRTCHTKSGIDDKSNKRPGNLTPSRMMGSVLNWKTVGSKPEGLVTMRTSASAGCGHSATARDAEQQHALRHGEARGDGFWFVSDPRSAPWPAWRRSRRRARYSRREFFGGPRGEEAAGHGAPLARPCRHNCRRSRTRVRRGRDGLSPLPEQGPGQFERRASTTSDVKGSAPRRPMNRISQIGN